VGGVYALLHAVRKGIFSSTGAVLIAVATAVSLSDAFAGVLVLLVVSAFDGLLKGLSESIWVLLIKDYFMALCVFTWAVRRAMREPSDAFSQRLAVPLLLFMVYAIVQVANPNSPDTRASVAGTRAWILWLPLFFVAFDAISSRQRLEWLMRVIVALAVIMAVYGLLQHFVGYDRLIPISPTFARRAGMYGWMTSEGVRTPRVFSTTVSPGNFASAMAFCGLLALGLLFYWRTVVARLAAAGTAGLCFAGMALSGTRSAILAAAFGGLVMLLLTRRPRLLLAAVAIALVVGNWASETSGGAVGERIASLWEDRAYTIERPTYPLRRGLATAIKHPLGVGTGTGVGVADRIRGEVVANELGLVENEFGRAFGELGIPGGLLFIYLVWVIVAETLKAQRTLRAPRAKLLGAGIFGAISSLLVLLMVGSALYGAPPAPFFWCMVAGLLRLAQFETAQAQDEGKQAATATYPRALQHAPATAIATRPAEDS
jgi:hypothetical protein